jgi:CRP/FNR family transcriptional regulator, cyclic AMP receptor protein
MNRQQPNAFYDARWEMTKLDAETILSSLPERLSALLFAGAKTCHLRAGDALFAAGDSGDGCYRLERGLLKVIITSSGGEERILAILGPGEIAGELSLIDRRPRSASLIAVKDCELSFISQKNFEKCTNQDPDIYRYLVNVLVSRLRGTDQAVAADSFLSVKARLARALIELTAYLGEDAGAGRVLIRHKISQSDLAAMAGVARENVSRALSDWKRRDLVTRSSGFYCLNDITKLKRYAASEPKRRARWQEWDDRIFDSDSQQTRNGAAMR